MELNQFRVTDTKGRVLNPDKGFRYDVQLSGGQVVPGDCVKLKNVAGSKTIVVEKIAADTDVVFGMVVYESAKANAYNDGEMLTVASDYSLVTCEASAEINAGVGVMPVIDGQKVATATASKIVIGTALTPAAAAGDIITVRLEKPALMAAG